MVDHGNYLPVNAHLRLGFRLVQKVLILKLFGETFFQPLRDGR